MHERAEKLLDLSWSLLTYLLNILRRSSRGDRVLLQVTLLLFIDNNKCVCFSNESTYFLGTLLELYTCSIFVTFLRRSLFRIWGKCAFSHLFYFLTIDFLNVVLVSG